MGWRDYGIGYDFARVQRGEQSVWPLASVFVDITLRRRGPESLPDSTFLVMVLLAIDIPISLVVFRLQGILTLANVVGLLLTTGLMFAFVFAVLRFFKLDRRYRQTVSAMLGVDIVITAAYVPVALIGLAFNAPLLEPPLLWVLLILYLWLVFISGFIFARALSQPLIVGLMFEILLVITGLSIPDFISPAAS
jgi:hypothetical protein